MQIQMNVWVNVTNLILNAWCNLFFPIIYFKFSTSSQTKYVTKNKRPKQILICNRYLIVQDSYYTINRFKKKFVKIRNLRQKLFVFVHSYPLFLILSLGTIITGQEKVMLNGKPISLHFLPYHVLRILLDFAQ